MVVEMGESRILTEALKFPPTTGNSPCKGRDTRFRPWTNTFSIDLTRFSTSPPKATRVEKGRWNGIILGHKAFIDPFGSGPAG